VLPALAVARALVERHGTGSVELVGSRRGLDAQLVRGTGIPTTLLPGRGFRRRAGAGALLENVSALAQLAAAAVMALVVVLRRRPSVVVAMGGYASVPAALAGTALGVPLVLVNVDAVPGAANRLVGWFASAAAVAFEGTRLPRAVVTGAPVREEVLAVSMPDQRARTQARRRLGIPAGRRVVGAVGGSLGARRLNEAVLGLAELWEDRSEFAVYHVVGARDAAWARQLVPPARPGGLWYSQVAYEERMPLFYEAADVVVCRAGASTVAELTAVGMASVIVPLPGAPGGHQAANASMLERAGAAVVVEDGSCTPERIARELERILADEALLGRMRAAAGGLGRRDALGCVVELVEAHARGGRDATGDNEGAGPNGPEPPPPGTRREGNR